MRQSDEQTTLSSEKLLMEAYRLAEQNVQSQVDLALAADQRAASFCGLCIAAIAALVGLTDNQNTEWHTGIAAAMLSISAFLSAFALRPVKFHIRGLPFENFKEDIENKREFSEVIEDLGQIYDNLISENRKRIKRNARCFRCAIYCAILGLLFMVVPFSIQPFVPNDNPSTSTGGTQ
ncbi:hypothetical protein [Maritimibacter sp. 55A14]|uniref:hypothetical protein n=1 Tax=Maritimibacter sp. 55A14 TaxID=2174844 RepID=UPI0011B26090|nr:hypothetical protein [Maritimibacter sp. 55A14]